MKVVFFSLTGQTRKFVKKTSLESTEIKQTNPYITMNEEFILVCPSYDKEASDIMEDFLETGSNQELCRGVVGCGNRNFAKLFCFTARDLAVDYDLPYLHELEFQGSQHDVDSVLEIVSDIELNRYTYLTPKEQGFCGSSTGSYSYNDFKVVKEKL